MLTLNSCLQIWIAVTGVASCWLISSSDRRLAHVGFAIGLAGQPAWLFTSASSSQWGQFLLTLVFTASYLRGLFPSHYQSLVRIFRK